MRILFFNIHMIGFQGLRIMSCRSVTMKAQFRSQAFSDFMMFSNESSLILPMIHSSEEPLQGETFPQGSMKKKSFNAPQGGL